MTPEWRICNVSLTFVIYVILMTYDKHDILMTMDSILNFKVVVYYFFVKY